MSTAIVSRDNHSPVGFETEADYRLVRTLLKDPLYVIPARLRGKVINCIETTIDDEEIAAATKLSAVRALNDLDKTNLDMVKIAMPKKTEVRDITKATDEELNALLQEVIKKLPPVADV